jgi:hypothetical protein
MNTSPCPTCRHDVIDTGSRLLNPYRSRLGRYLPDGIELTPRQQADTTIRGHHLHHCTSPKPPPPPATQEALF